MAIEIEMAGWLLETKPAFLLFLSPRTCSLSYVLSLGGQRAWWGPGSFSLPPLPALPCGGGALVEELDGQIVGVAEH